MSKACVLNLRKNKQISTHSTSPKITPMGHLKNVSTLHYSPSEVTLAYLQLENRLFIRIQPFEKGNINTICVDTACVLTFLSTVKISGIGVALITYRRPNYQERCMHLSEGLCIKNI